MYLLVLLLPGFEVQPSPGVKVSRIVNLTDDIALSLAAQGIRIEAQFRGSLLLV